MNTRVDRTTVATALALCVGYYAVSVFIWGFIAAHNPISLWLVREVAPVSLGLARALMLLMDFAISLLLAYPFALLLFRLRRPELWIGVGGFALGWVALSSPLLLLQPWELIVAAVTSTNFWLILVSLVLAIVLAGRVHPRAVASGI